MVLNLILGGLAVLSLVLVLWQARVARRFPLHRREPNPGFAPGVTFLKPLKGCDSVTAACLESWFDQQYPGPRQILFAVASAEDPVCAVVRDLIARRPETDAELVLCPDLLGPNAKVSSLVQIERRARHSILVISDADVFVPPDLTAQAVLPLRDPAAGLVNCFYRLASPVNTAMRLEALAVNTDFWSQVLQSLSLKPMDFALGAVMATTRGHLAAIGGFSALLDYLADDYQLGRKIAATGARIALCPVVVECRSSPQTWQEVWTHQLRWARTIRVCQPGPYFSSILHNPTLWPLVWAAAAPGAVSGGFLALCLGARLWTARAAMARLCQGQPAPPCWLAPAKDLLQAVLWCLAFTGRHVSWRGRRFRVLPDGRLAARD